MVQLNRAESLQSLDELAGMYDVPFEDVLFIDLNRKGIRSDVKHVRVRFYFRLSDNPYLKTSKETGIMDYFFAMPTQSGISNYYHTNSIIKLENQEEIGYVTRMVDDTVDSVYPRKNGTVMNLNPSLKSACTGCDFCYVDMLTPNDRDRIGTDAESFLVRQIEKWLKNYEKEDLSYLHRVDVVTGCFGGERKTVDNLFLIRDVFSRYNYGGEIFYLGSEITSDEALSELKEIGPFALCLTLECFDKRDDRLKSHKGKIGLDEAKRILGTAQDLCFGSQFTYIAGLEPLTRMLDGMEEFSPYINRLPVINIFQPHNLLQRTLLTTEAEGLEYFLKARKSIKKIFERRGFRPRTWGNYRSLWYLKMDDDILRGERLP